MVACLGGHVGRAVDALLRIVGHLGIEALLDILEHLLVVFAADERDGETLGTETTSTTDTVKVRVGFGGKIVVDGQVDALDIDTTTENVSGNTNSLVELFELLVALDTE